MSRESGLFEAAPARSPTRPPNASILWVAGWGSGPVPECAAQAHSQKRYCAFVAGSAGFAFSTSTVGTWITLFSITTVGTWIVLLV